MIRTLDRHSSRDVPDLSGPSLHPSSPFCRVELKYLLSFCCVALVWCALYSLREIYVLVIIFVCSTIYEMNLLTVKATFPLSAVGCVCILEWFTGV